MMPAIVSGLGSLTETRMSTIGQFTPLSLVTAPEVFAEIILSQFPTRF